MGNFTLTEFLYVPSLRVPGMSSGPYFQTKNGLQWLHSIMGAQHPKSVQDPWHSDTPPLPSEILFPNINSLYH